jgi:MFS family permease
MSHFNMLAFPALVIPLTTQFNMPMAGVLEISFLMYLMFGVSALPWGIAGDKWGGRKFFVIFYAGCGLSGVASAFFMARPEYLMISLASLGLFSGIYHPIGSGMISREIKRVSIGMGYNGMFGNLGLAVAPFLAGLINWFWGLKAVYLFLGGMNFIGLVLMFVLSRHVPKEAETLTKEPSGDSGNGLLSAFFVLLIVMMLGGIEYRGATVIMPAYFELKTQNIFTWFSSFTGGNLSGNVFATFVTSFIFFIGIIGQYIGGRLGDRFDPKLGYLIFHLVTIPAAILISITSDISLVLVATVYFFFLLGMQPIENTLVAKFTPRRFHHSAYGTKFVLTFGVGAMAVKMVGAIETYSKIENVFLVIGVIAILLVSGIGILISVVKKTDNAIVS